MSDFLLYAKGIIFQPEKTLKKFSSDNRTSAYIYLFLILQVVLGFLRQDRVPQNIFQPSPIAISVKFYLDFISSSPFSSLLLFFIITSILHLVSRRYSKKGSLKILIKCLGFITTFGAIIFFVLNSVSYLKILQPVFTIWIIYLEMVVISVVYDVTFKKSLIILIQGLIILSLFFIISMGFFVFFDLTFLHIAHNLFTTV